MRKATIEFNASARMDDMLDVGMSCVRVGNSSILFQGGLFRGDELLVSLRAGLRVRRPGHADLAPGARAAARAVHAL